MSQKNIRSVMFQTREQRTALGLQPKDSVVVGNDVATELYDAIRAELVVHHGEFTAADAIRIVNLGMLFLKDFTAIDKQTKHKILSSTIQRIVREVDMPENTRELLTALMNTDFFDGVIHAAVELYNLAQQAFLKKFDLDHDGAVTLQEVQQVCCGPAGCCAPRGTVITPAHSLPVPPPAPRGK